MPLFVKYDPSQTVDQSFKCIFDTYKQRLYRFCLLHTHSPYYAEETTQEVFIKLWLHRESLPAITDMNAYVFTIARHAITDRFRKIASDEKIIRQLARKMTDTSHDTEEKINTAEIDRIVNEALRQMPLQRRLVYSLSRHQGKNYEEIGATLSLSPHTVKNHLVHALRFIRAQLRGSGILFTLFFLAVL